MLKPGPVRGDADNAGFEARFHFPAYLAARAFVWTVSNSPPTRIAPYI